MSNILITGSAGFIGSHLMTELSKHNQVVGIDNFSHACKSYIPEVEYCDVRYYKDLLSYFNGCDTVFHLAAQISVDRSIENPEETIATNVLGAQNILELARRYKTKVIFASTSEIYGGSQTELMGESHPLDCQSPYGASKLSADRLCYSYWKTFGLDVVIVRNFNTFGERQSDDSYGGVIAKFCKAALKNEPLCIYGDGTQERDYMHITDAIQAYSIAQTIPSGSAVNFGSGETIRIIDLANMIIRLTNSKSKIIHAEKRRGEVQRLCADITKAREYGFNPVTDFEKDLGGYIKWLQQN